MKTLIVLLAIAFLIFQLSRAIKNATDYPDDFDDLNY